MNALKRYSDEEIAAIFRIAAALPDAAGAGPASSGLTLAQVQEIGREAGIDPAQVAAAAAIVGTGAPTERSGLGVRTRDERLLQGEVSEEAWAEWVREIEDALGRRGAVSYLPGALRWRHRWDDCDPLEVEVSSSGGWTQLRVELDRRPSAILSFSVLPVAGAVGAMVGGAALGLDPRWLWPLGGAGLAAGAAAVVALWRWTGARFHRRIRHLLERLVARHALARTGDGSGMALPGKDGAESF